MDKISEKGMETNKRFLNFIKPFMTNEGMISSNDITLTDGKMSSQMSMKLQRHLTNTALTLSKKVAKTNLIKLVQHSGI